MKTDRSKKGSSGRTATAARASGPSRTKGALRKGKAKKTKAGAKKRRVVLFVPEKTDEPARPEAPPRVLPWACAGCTPRRSAHTGLRLEPPLEVSERFRLKARAGVAPVVSDDGVLYVADREGELRGIEIETGKTVLSVRTDPIHEASPAWALVSQGLVPKDRVPVSAPAAVFGWHIFFGDDEGVFYAVRRGDGEVVWRHAAPLSLAARKGEAYQAPFVVGEVVYAVDSDGNLHATSLKTHQTLFDRFLRGHPCAPPALGGRRVLVATRPSFGGERPALHAIDPATGDRLWHADLPGIPGRALAASDDLGFVGGPLGLCAFRLDRGELRWHLPEAVTGGIALDDRRVYAPNERGISALFQGTGEAVWTSDPRKVPAPIAGTSLALSGGILWAAIRGGLAALDAETGALVGKLRTPSDVVGGPIVAAGRLIASTEGRDVLAWKPVATKARKGVSRKTRKSR